MQCVRAVGISLLGAAFVGSTEGVCRRGRRSMPADDSGCMHNDLLMGQVDEADNLCAKSTRFPVRTRGQGFF